MSGTLSFQYKAMDGRGASRRGSIVAGTAQEAYRKIAAMGLTPLAIDQARPGLGQGGRMRSRDISHFTSQLATLMGARIPIGTGLLSIAEQERDPRLKALITDIAGRIESGEPMATALSAHERAFGTVYIETVRAAEKSGTVVKVLDHLAEMLEKEAETRRQVKGAFMYPMCVLCVLAAGVTFLIGFVIPKFSGMFASRGVDLPTITRVLMVLGDSVRGWWWAYLACGVSAVFGVRRAWATPGGRRVIDGMLHRIPVLRELLKGLALSRFSRVFGLTLASGLPLTECLQLAGRTGARPGLERDVGTLIDQVRRGGRLTDALPACPYLSPFARRMLSAGEESAELPKMCGVIALHYERETTHLSKNVAALIEPILIVLIAGVVLVVAVAIFLPMWDMVNLVK
jgi:type II secretory pathway component PulF